MTPVLHVGDRLRAEESLRSAVRLTNQALREAADRLVVQQSTLPPGSVLRCFSKSVRTALLTGFPFSEVAAEAERLTRQELALRPVDERRRRAALRADDLTVPRPRPR